MKLFLLLTTWLAFGLIASAQCPNGQCQTRTTITRTVTVYETLPAPQPSRYITLQPAPQVYAAPVTVYYVERPRFVGPVRRFLGCR